MISAQDIWKSVGEGPGRRELFHGLSLQVGPGESLALVGPSGSGKTSLLRILGGLSLPDKGEVTLGQQRLRALTTHGLAKLRGSRIGFVFQADNLLPHLTALENVRLPEAFHLKGRTSDRAALDALGRVGLLPLKHQAAAKLSGGEAQRVAVARALSQKPDLLLCDEPTGSLDALAAVGVSQLLLESCRETRCALLIATHDLEVAARCQRQLRLGSGA